MRTAPEALRLRCAAGKPRHLSRNGLSFVYVIIMMMAIIGVLSLSVDIGRIRVAKGQLQTASDAAAMGAAMTLPLLDTVSGSWDFTDIDNVAVQLANANPVTVDHVPATLLSDTDIEYGIWAQTTRTFTKLTGESRAVRERGPRHG